MSDPFEMILDKVESYPDKMAVWTETGSFTFRELYDYSLRAAEAMKCDGLSKGECITIELPRCREYFGFMVASWMLGAYFVPSDNSYPEDRKSYMAEDSKAKLRVDTDYISKVGQSQFKGGPFKHSL